MKEGTLSYTIQGVIDSAKVVIAYEIGEEEFAEWLQREMKVFYNGIVELTEVAALARREGPLVSFDLCVLVISSKADVDLILRAMAFVVSVKMVVGYDNAVLPEPIRVLLRRIFPRSQGATTIAVWIVGYLRDQSVWEQREQVRAEKIEKNLPQFIDPALERLNDRMVEAKSRANSAYAGGVASLFLAVLVAVVFSYFSPVPNSHGIGIFIASMAYSAFRGLIVIGILVAISKYLFNLGKAWMTESLRNADRMHAISFGRFYLEVFGGEAKGEEIRQVFETWNIDTNSTFAALDANDHDPKLFDKAMDLVGKSTELVKAAVGDKAKDAKKE